MSYCCSVLITFLRTIIRVCVTTCCRCCCSNFLKPVYVIDPENGSTTRTFRKSFQLFVSYGIEFKSVSLFHECTENYPIAILCRKQTDRATEDIQSILDQLPGVQNHKRIAIIYIDVKREKRHLPIIPTAQKTNEFENLGIIVDFGFNPKNKVWNIYTCQHNAIDDSREAFEKFVEKIMFRCSSAVANYNSMCDK